MSWFHFSIIVLCLEFTRSRPAVRIRVTRKGLNYAINTAMDYEKKQVKNYTLPDKKGKRFGLTYAFTNMTFSNFNISERVLEPSPVENGMYMTLKQIDFDIKGKWIFQSLWYFRDSGVFDISVNGLSVIMLFHLGVNVNRLVVSNITCHSTLDSININLHSSSLLLSFIQQTLRAYALLEIPRITCEEGKKAMTKILNEQFTKFPVKQNLKKSVTLDYSVVKEPQFTSDAVDLILKGEFQPTDGCKECLHPPSSLPRDDSRDRMMYITIMDHMINSASHAYYNQDALRVQFTVKQAPQLIGSQRIFKAISSYLTPANTGLGMIKQSGWRNCELGINMSAVSPPKIRTNLSGIHLTVHTIAKVNVALPNSVGHEIDIEANVSAVAIPRLEGANLSTNITTLNIDAKVVKSTMFNVSPARLVDIKKIVKKQIEKLLENDISAMKIPLPLSKRFPLVNPKISYGKGYMTMETDVSMM